MSLACCRRQTKPRRPLLEVPRIDCFDWSRSSDSPIISITLSAAKSAEEHIYVRWTTNNWTTSQFVEALGSGTAYSATLPAMPNGTSVNYYILTSTATPSTGLTSATADALTLSIDADSGNNYQYITASDLSVCSRLWQT